MHVEWSRVGRDTDERKRMTNEKRGRERRKCDTRRVGVNAGTCSVCTSANMHGCCLETFLSSVHDFMLTRSILIVTC